MSYVADIKSVLNGNPQRNLQRFPLACVRQSPPTQAFLGEVMSSVKVIVWKQAPKSNILSFFLTWWKTCVDRQAIGWVSIYMFYACFWGIALK